MFSRVKHKYHDRLRICIHDVIKYRLYMFSRVKQKSDERLRISNRQVCTMLNISLLKETVAEN
jgi:hypothetical protein